MTEIVRTVRLELSESDARNIERWMGAMPLFENDAPFGSFMRLYRQLNRAVEGLNPPKPKRRWWQ